MREVEKTENPLKVDKVGFWHENLDEANGLIDIINAIEIGRIIARDIGGSDPERMAAPRVVDYVHDLFKSTDVKVGFFLSDVNFIILFNEDTLII